MKRNVLHALWLISAVLLVAAGIGMIVTANQTMETVAMWIGIVTVVSGALQLVVNWLLRDNIFGDRAFLIKAVVTTVVGVFMLCNGFIASEVLRVLVSMMVLVDGISVLGAALAMNHDRIPGRAWLWVIGLIETALGVAGFLKPEILNITIGIIAGVSLIYEGLVLVYTWFIGMRWRKTLNL